MGTTRVKLIDLSSDKKEVKTSRKHAQKITVDVDKETKVTKGTKGTEGTEEKIEALQSPTPSVPSVPSVPSNLTAAQKNPKLGEATKPAASIRGKKYQSAANLIDKDKSYPAAEAIELLYKTSTTKFDPTVEVHLNVSEKNVRGSVNFPHSIGAKKEKKYLVFSAKKPSAEIKNTTWGDSETVNLIESGKLKPNRDFDVVVATPQFMPQLAKVAKILGPAGMMPNPKNGTVTDDVTKVLGGSADSNVEYRTDPTTPVVHSKLGKLSFKSNQIQENLRALTLSIGPNKIKKIIIKSTMSPAIKIDIPTITAK